MLSYLLIILDPNTGQLCCLACIMDILPDHSQAKPLCGLTLPLTLSILFCTVHLHWSAVSDNSECSELEHQKMCSWCSVSPYTAFKQSVCPSISQYPSSTIPPSLPSDLGMDIAAESLIAWQPNPPSSFVTPALCSSPLYNVNLGSSFNVWLFRIHTTNQFPSSDQMCTWNMCFTHEPLLSHNFCLPDSLVKIPHSQ